MALEPEKERHGQEVDVWHVETGMYCGNSMLAISQLITAQQEEMWRWLSHLRAMQSTELYVRALLWYSESMPKADFDRCFRDPWQAFLP